MAFSALDAAAFALVSAVLWGLSPVFTKKGLARGGTSVQAAMVIILTTGALSWAALLATSGTTAFNGFTPTDAGIFVLGGVVGTTLGRLSSYAGVDRVGASVTTAVANTRPLFSMVLAVAFLGETVTAVTAVGVFTLVVGIVVLSMVKGGSIGGWRTAELAFPLAAALAFATGNVIRRSGFLLTPASTLEAITLNETAAMFTLGTYLLVYRRDRIRAVEHGPVPYFVAAGAINAGGLFSLFHALSLGRVTIVDPLSGMAPLFATLFTSLLLRDVEHVTRGVVVGASLIVLGGALVVL